MNCAELVQRMEHFSRLGKCSEALFELGLLWNITPTRKNNGGDIVAPVVNRNDPIVWREKRSVGSRTVKQLKQRHFAQIPKKIRE